MRGFKTFATAMLLVAASSACGGSEPAASGQASTAPSKAPPWFREVAAPAGLAFTHVNVHVRRFWMPEISPGGVAFLDYDGDGWLDIYCIQSGEIAGDIRPAERNQLFHNRGDGTFEDVTDAAGVGDTGYGNGCAVGDYDNDGDVDLYVTNLKGNVFYRNDGNGKFTDATEETGTRLGRWSTAAAFLDYDRDGDLDLFVVNNLNWSSALEVECRSAQAEKDYCSPKNYNLPSHDTLYRNDGNGRFTDVTREAGIEAATGIGLGLAVADFDGDGDADIYVANDSVPNVLWINDGQGHFKNMALLLGCAVNENGAPEASMGIHAPDLDADGDWDLFMTHVRGEKNTFYLNTKGSFSDRTSVTGLVTPSRPMTGFGMGFVDFDLDGHLDLFVANGRVELWRPYVRDDMPYAEPNQVFRGGPALRFTEIDAGIGGLVGTSRGAAFGDYDNDGDIDIVYMDLNAPVRLLENIAPRHGVWIAFRLLNGHGSDSIGAVTRIETPAGPQFRRCDPSYSYTAANDPRVHFGLGPASEASSVLVTWPDGKREEFGSKPGGQIHVLRQGTGTAPAR